MEQARQAAAPGILTAKEVAEYLRVSERTVLDWAQKGEIPCGKLGGSWRFQRDELERWVRGRLVRRARPVGLAPVSIEKVMSPDRVLLFDGTPTKSEVLGALVDCLAETPAVGRREELADAIFTREKLMSTGIGLGLGVPHCRLASVSGIVMAGAACPAGIRDYESMDGRPVTLVFMVAAERDAHADYIRLLATLTSRLKDEALRKQLLESRDPVSFYQALLRASRDAGDGLDGEAGEKTRGPA